MRIRMQKLAHSFISGILKHKIRTILILIVLVIVVFILFRKSNHVIYTEAYSVTRNEVIKTITASGKTDIYEDLVVRAPVSAKVAEVPFKSGTPVIAGDIIIKLDKKSLRAAANSSWSDYLSAKATMDSLDQQILAAKADVSRTKHVRDQAWRDYNGNKNYEHKGAFTTTEAAFQASEASLKVLEDKRAAINQASIAAYNAYEIAKDDLNQGDIVAPISGLLALEDVYKDSLLTVGQKLFTVTSKETTDFVAEVDESDINSLKVGQKAIVTLDGYPFKTFDGKVVRIDAKTEETDDGGVIINTTIMFNLGDITPIVGLSGSADIEVYKDSTQLSVPIESVNFDDKDNTYVFVIKDETVEKRIITVDTEGDTYYTVKEGLLEGEQIATGENAAKLYENAKISINKDK